MGGRRETGHKDSRNQELEKFSSEQRGMMKFSKEGQGPHRAVELLMMIHSTCIIPLSVYLMFSFSLKF
jgi:hypothetical protein